MYDEINPDIFEILLSHRYQLACVLRGELAYETLFLHVVNIENSFFKMSRILYHSSFNALDPELIQDIFSEIYPDTPPYRTAEIVANIPNKVKHPGIDMDYVKFSLWDHQVMEHHIRLYEALVSQTDNLSPLKLGKRVIFVPENIPRDFNGIERMWGQLLKDEPDPELLEENLVHPLTDDDLTRKLLEYHREKYDACISVTPEHRRLYTRSRIIVNMFISLQPYLTSAVAHNYNTSTDLLTEFVGAKVQTILLDNYKYSLDKDNYPVFSKLYTHGAMGIEMFPKIDRLYSLSGATDICFCGGCGQIPYVLYLYESNSGDVYVIIVLKATDHSHFVKYINSLSCYFELYKCLKNHPDWCFVSKDVWIVRPPLDPADTRYILPGNQLGEDGMFHVVPGQKFVKLNSSYNIYHLRPRYSRVLGQHSTIVPEVEIRKIMQELCPTGPENEAKIRKLTQDLFPKVSFAEPKTEKFTDPRIKHWTGFSIKFLPASYSVTYRLW